jgi:hypothetical protein
MDNLDTILDNLKNATVVVEANSFEELRHWEKWSPRRKWEQTPIGHVITIGKLDDRPVVIQFNYAKINGESVVFWHATSQVVDYKMIDKWMMERVNPSAMKTDSMNFGNAIGFLDNIAESRV